LQSFVQEASKYKAGPVGIFDSETKTYSQINIHLGLLFVAAVSIFLAGCSPSPNSAAPELGEPQAEPSPSQSEDTKFQNEPIACDEKTQTAIEETVNSQTKAFSDSDYELAYSFASPAFRSSVTLEGFVAIISSSYGPLIDSSNLRFSGCLVNADTGFALIDVSFLQAGKFVYGLRYLVTETLDGWRVEGASNLQVVGEGT